MVNSITLFGCVTSELSSNVAKNGTLVANFTLTHRGSEPTKSFKLKVEAWDREAKRLESFVKEGCEVIVYGRLTCEKWVCHGGKKKCRFKLTANKVVPSGKSSS